MISECMDYEVKDVKQRGRKGRKNFHALTVVYGRCCGLSEMRECN